MPIQIQDVHDKDDTVDCPLCMETLEVDDINFFPCECGYQICRFCWHRIRTDENGLCPACRKAYPENPAEFKPLSEVELQKIRQEKKQKEVARRQKITDSRKHLANVRVLQKNLVFVVGLSQRLADMEILKRPEYFGKYGKILKVVLNSNTSYAGSQTPSCSAYVTYSKVEESLRAIQSVNNVHIDGRTLKASLGTTKYCSNYLKNQVCQKHDCMYLHEIGDEDASFTKEDMQNAKHQEYEQKLIEQMIQKEIQQEMKAKALRQEASENDSESAGSSPPVGTITSGLSVAQAVMKNSKAVADSTICPRRHSVSAGSDPATEGDGAQVAKSIDPGPKLSSSVGDRHGGGTKASASKSGKRSAAKKGRQNFADANQAPRHKKQQQLQQQQQQVTSEAKKAPPRAPRASPPRQVAGAWPGMEHSPSTSMPSSTGASMESSPASTPLGDFALEPSKAHAGQKSHLNEVSSNLAFGLSEQSQTSSAATNVRALAQPIDIPSSSEDKNRGTPHSDSSSSVGRKSPFIRDSFSQDAMIQPNMSSMENSVESSGTVLTKSKFTMLHKDSNDDPLSRIVANSLGFAPFGMPSHPAQASLLQDIQMSQNCLPTSQPLSKVMPPPGLSNVMPQDVGGWPNSHLSITDTIPIPVKRSNNWEAALGFNAVEKEETTSPGDDDLGFDPWLECSKGLADLMEKEKTQSSESGQIPMAHPPQPSFSDLSAQQRRPPQMGFSGGSDLVNGFSNLLSNVPHGPPQQKMPFQMEQSRFLSQQRMANHFQTTEPHPLLGPANAGNKQSLHGPMNPLTHTSDKNNIQEWQNGLRALLPSVNINFANQGNAQRQPPRAMDSSLGLSNLGMPSVIDHSKAPGISHPPGISNSSLNQNIFQSKQNAFPPSWLGMNAPRVPFMGARQHQWGGSESSMSNPGPVPSNRLVSPTGLQSLFAGGYRSESNPMPGSMPSYPPDPAIIQGGMPGFGPTTRRTRLFESSQSKSSNFSSINNTNDDQPHWMKSLQALTEPDSPRNQAPQTHNNANSALGQLFLQHRSNNVPSWPPMPGLLSNTGFGQSQPPPGFQVRPSLTKPTEFGVLHNLLENQT